MSVKLKRLYLENYKLFTSKEIVFEDLLSVFDGPNGYGKTSIFDSIEFLITGVISRISESVSISGTLAYTSNFLAKDQQKDVVIKGEFLDEESIKRLVIVLKIPVVSGSSSKRNNPKNIDSSVVTYVLPSYNTPVEDWNKYVVETEELSEIRRNFFGKQNIEFFTMFHYIRQEDRLSYFKYSEADRTKKIENLFGVEEYASKAALVDRSQKQLHKRINTLTDSIKALSNDISSLPKEAGSNVEYVALANGKPLWDYKEFDFRGSRSKAVLDDLKGKISGIKELYLYRNEYRIADSIATFTTIPEDQRMATLVAWKIQREKKVTIHDLQYKKEKQEQLSRQKILIEAHKYSDIDWKQFCANVGLEELTTTLIDLTTQILQASANQTDLQKSLSALNRCRNQLHDASKHTELTADRVCPYCGHNWTTSAELESRFLETQDLIDGILSRETDTFSKVVQKCDRLCEEKCIPALNAALSNLENDILLQIYNRFPTWQSFDNCAKKCDGILQVLGITPRDIMVETTLENTFNGVTSLLDRITKAREAIPAEYYSADEKFNFHQLFEDSFSSLQDLEALSVDKIECKEKYIIHQYYRSFDESRKELARLENQLDVINKLYLQLKNYGQVLQNAITAYQQIVIEAIEIPFFLYSSRLLQSYQGGQGILIKSDGKTVRFTAPGSEHDVLYTMSSGQLSAVLLAFSLALNKIYAGEKFQTILIDDPIQCMDDINMISFVELLSKEFSKAQIILSTHEDSFSNFIRYKFDKYRLPQQAITLKDS